MALSAKRTASRLALSLPDLEAHLARVGEWYGLRVLVAWGWGRTARILAIILWLGLLVDVILVARSDLLYPADFGSDTSNYAAFGERFVEHGSLYALSPGDRPVPADNEPEWTVPLLSPPQMAVPWGTMAFMPDAIRFYLPWAVGLAGTIAVAILFLQRAPAALVLMSLPLFKGLAITAWSGNVNAFIAPAALLACWAGRDHSRRLSVLVTGGIVASLGVVKIGPTLLWVWLIGRRPRAAIAGGVVAVAVLSGIVVAVAGVGPYREYLDIAAVTATNATGSGLQSLLGGLGLPVVIVRAVWIVTAVVLTILAVRSRTSPILAFVAVASGIVVLTPIVRVETLAVAVVVVGTPWTAVRRPIPLRWPAAVGVGFAVVSIGLSIATGGLAATTMSLENGTSQTVIVRFVAQSASWGYVLAPGERGLAWAQQTGRVLGPYALFDTDCRALDVGEVDRVGGSFEVDVEEVSRDELVTKDQYLTYDARCSAAMAAALAVREP